MLEVWSEALANDLDFIIFRVSYSVTVLSVLFLHSFKLTQIPLPLSALNFSSPFVLPSDVSFVLSEQIVPLLQISFSCYLLYLKWHSHHYTFHLLALRPYPIFHPNFPLILYPWSTFCRQIRSFQICQTQPEFNNLYAFPMLFLSLERPFLFCGGAIHLTSCITSLANW